MGILVLWGRAQLLMSLTFRRPCQVKGHWMKEEGTGVIIGVYADVGAQMRCHVSQSHPGVAWIKITLAAWSRGFRTSWGPRHGATGAHRCSRLSVMYCLPVWLHASSLWWQSVWFLHSSVTYVFVWELYLLWSNGQEYCFVLFCKDLYQICGSCKFLRKLFVWYGLRPFIISITLCIFTAIFCLEILRNLRIYLVFVRISPCILWNPWISVLNLQYLKLKSSKFAIF